MPNSSPLPDRELSSHEEEDSPRAVAGEPLIQRTKLTPAEIARRWGIKSHKVLAWIRSGELRAINAAETMTGRPRYLVDVKDLAAFERAREVVCRNPRTHNRSQNVGITEFF